MADINPDLAAMSTEQLLALRQQAVSNMAINQNESGGAPDTATGIVNPASGARGNMQVMPATAQNPGFGVQPSNGTPQDDARVGRDYHAALTQKYGDPETAAIAYNMGPAKTDNWIANGRDLSQLPTETLNYLKNFKTTVQANQPVMNDQTSGTGPAPVAYGAPSAVLPAPPPTAGQRAQAAIAALKPTDYSGMTAAGLRQLGLTARAAGNGIANGAGALTQGFTRAMGVPDVQPIISNAVNSVTPAPQGALEQGVQNVGSQVANPLNYVPGLAGTGPVRGAIGGAVAAGMQPTPQGTTPQQVAQNMLVGGATGGTLGMAAPLLQGATVRPAAQALMDAKVGLTPGQALGGVANTLEQKATSIPVLGDLVSGARASAVRDMNTAVGNQVLAPIGATVDKGTPTRELVSQVGQKISSEYDRILPQLTFRTDPQLAQDMAPVMQRVQGLPPDAQNAFMSSWQRNFQSQMTSRGTMTGTQFKDADSAFGLEARNFSQSQDAYQRNLGAAMTDAQTALRSSLERTNPNAPSLGPINQAWRNYTVLRNAGARVNNPESPIQPGQLQAAVKAGAGGGPAGRGAFASGNANMQGIADNSMAVLGSTVPDSGTAGRGALMAVPPALYGLGHMALNGHPVPAAATALGLGLGAGSYGTQAGRNAMIALLARRPGLLRGLGATSGSLAPAAGAGVAAAASGVPSLDQNRGQDQQ